jgi:molybdate transport system regulatory protein
LRKASIGTVCRRLEAALVDHRFASHRLEALLMRRGPWQLQQQLAQQPGTPSFERTLLDVTVRARPVQQVQLANVLVKHSAGLGNNPDLIAYPLNGLKLFHAAATPEPSSAGDVIAVGPGKVALLEAIDKTGSITAAAKGLDMSYRRAWVRLAELNRSLREPAVESAKSGAAAGGSALTDAGRQVVMLYRTIESKATVACRAEIRKLMSMLARRAAATGSCAWIIKAHNARACTRRIADTQYIHRRGTEDAEFAQRNTSLA